MLLSTLPWPLHKLALQIQKFLQMALGLHGSVTNRHPPSPAATELVLLLVKSSVQPPSIPTYKRAWKLFSQFLFNILLVTSAGIPISPPTLALVIAYLFDRHYASSAVNTFVSDISYIHKLAGFT